MAAASSASEFSDSELRAELKRHGFNAGPVTGSTRPLLIKKLLKLQGNDKPSSKVAKKPVPSRKLLGFSSDESDSEHNGARSRNTSAKNVRRRSTPARTNRTTDSPSSNNNDVPNSFTGKFNATPKPSKSSRSSLGRSNLRTSAAEAASKSRVNSRADSPPATGEFSDSDVDVGHQVNGTMDEDDEYEAAEVATNTSRRSSTNTSRASIGLGRRSLGRSGLSLNSTYALNDDDFNDQTPQDTQPAKPSFNKTLRTSTPRRPTRSRLGDNSSSSRKSNSAFVPDDSIANRSRYRPNASYTVGGGDDSRSSKARSPHESNHSSGGSMFNQYGDEPAGGDTLLEHEFETEEKLGSTLGSKYGHSYIPMVLLMCAFLFFVSLAVMYYSVGAMDATVDLKDQRYLLCSDTHKNGCMDLSGAVYSNAMKIVEALYIELSGLAGMAECDQLPDGAKRNMTTQQARAYLISSFKAEVDDNAFWIDDHIEAAYKMIIHNEHWGVRLFGEDSELINNETSEKSLVHKVKTLDSKHPHMPWLCRVRRSAVLVLFRVCMIILAFLLAWLLFLYIRYWLRREEEEKAQVHQLVEKIIEMLSNHSRACSKDKSLAPYLAIPHVRDTLIPLTERRRKQKLWNRAVQFLNDESRVRVETQQVAGEEFPVWRWVQPASVIVTQSFAPITEQDLNPNRVKVWQGTAFDNIDSAVKAPSYTPTPCLKIRNMFDLTLESGADWQVAIEDAILEKCGANDGILHLAVDKNSREGCVYMKCTHPEKAGLAYRALQGSWFDGKLVTVKYLRLDRYHQRFPNAINCTMPLQPSNNLKKSLSKPPHSSALESS